MKSRKVKAAAKSKAFMSKKKLKGDIPLDVSDSGSELDPDSFFHDEIDDYHKVQDDQLSTDDELIQKKAESSDEEEVLPITDDEKDSNDDEDDLPKLDAWGKKKSMYYNADFVDEDRGRTYREEDAEAAKAEAEEAYAIEKSLYSNIATDRLGATLFLEDPEESEEEEQPEENLTSATKQEKIKFLKKTCPELFEYCDDFKLSMSEIQSRLLPLLPLAFKEKLPTEACAEYVKIKYNLLLHLSMNINFYMMLKSSGTKTHHHPVLQRILSFKKLLDNLKSIDVAATDDMDYLVQKLKQKEPIALRAPVSKTSTSADSESSSDETSAKAVPVIEKEKMKKAKRKNIDTEAEKEIMSLISEVRQEIKKRKEEKEEEEAEKQVSKMETDNQMEDKRHITYEIAKNKGLGPKRKKEYRNPRVKHRIKFRKAKIRRKGQVREVVKEIKRYEGEPTGISTHVVKSIRMK